MALIGLNGGLVGARRAGAASGLWTANEQVLLRRAALWPNDSFFSNVSLLLHMNGANTSPAFTDNSPSPKAVTALGNAQISTAQSKFGGASGLFDGTGDYCQTPNNAAFQFGSGNFTIEYWVYPTSLTGIKQHINPDNGSNTSYAILTSGSALLYYLSSVGGSSWDVASGVSIGTATLNTWQHIALVRNGNVFTPYLNGVAGTTTTSSATLFNFTSKLTIGSDGPVTPLTPFQGYMDEVRITKGVARYTANFTPSTAAFPDA
jgi:hypothetical protein